LPCSVADFCNPTVAGSCIPKIYKKKIFQRDAKAGKISDAEIEKYRG
jgi:hypothetical protein